MPHRKKAQYDWIHLRLLILAERRLEALGENLVCIVRTAWIHRTRLRVVHSGLAKLTAEVCWVVGDAVAIFDECMNLP
ncbi:hypothetical protein AMR74_15575 [Halorubrum tropicale]|uniref:Uncharacterized protein n=1 Tax=Halorubrum tropicale TaxID=1765655 RepID=A0A0M9AQE8_9EURY|nr:hypothetical protein AMR74_15575 [Halorubrum tropicale]